MNKQKQKNLPALKTRIYKDKEGEKFKVERSSGNIFYDLGFENHEELFVRSQLACAIALIVQKRKMKQVDVAKLLGLTQGRVSELVNGKLDKFSLDRLISILNALDQRVRIVVEGIGRSKSKKCLIEVDLQKLAA